MTNNDAKTRSRVALLVKAGYEEAEAARMCEKLHGLSEDDFSEHVAYLAGCRGRIEAAKQQAPTVPAKPVPQQTCPTAVPPRPLEHEQATAATRQRVTAAAIDAYLSDFYGVDEDGQK